MGSRRDNSKVEDQMIWSIDLSRKKRKKRPSLKYHRAVTGVVRRDKNGNMVEVAQALSQGDGR